MLKSGKWLVFLVAIAMLMATLVTINAQCMPESDGAPEIIDEVWDIVLRDHVDTQSFDEQKLAEAAIRGLLKALDDPYTSYLGPEQSEISRHSLEGDFSGIGATITLRDGVLTVVAPLPDSPAEKAGLKSGDKILEVDGEPTEELSLIEATVKIRGKAGTKVRLLIEHPGEAAPVEVEITRAKIEIPSVLWEMLPGNISHIEITSFSERTHNELAAVLEEAREQQAVGIILDLRDNYGGVVSGAVSVTSEFVSEGVVLYALDNDGNRRDWFASEGGSALEIPLAVLVNGNSASASEILAGALQDYDRGPVIGTTTFGKGTMQEVRDLSNGGALHVTFAKWYTPEGQAIQDVGITPDIVVEMTDEDMENGDDPQLDRAVEYLMEGD